MKTRNLLVAMALPTLFAACTAEEIVSQADNNVLENRALLGDLVVNVEGATDSRVAWNEATLNWGAWEDTDAFGSALVDPTFGTVTDNLLTNYVWKKNGETWSTTSQMVEGTYSFYSYKGVAAKNDRKMVAFDLTSQKADLNNPTKVINDNQLFFSPLYQVAAENTTAENNIALPLAFYPYHSIGAFKMVNASGEDLLISQIIVNGTAIYAKGEIQPTLIETGKLVYSVREDETEYKLPMKDATTEYTADEIKEFWQEGDFDNAADAKTITMDCGNWKWEAGAEIMPYMVIPAGATVESVRVNVVNEAGEAMYFEVKDATATGATFTSSNATVKLDIPSVGMKTQEFKRSMPVSVFGKLSTNAPKSVSVTARNLKEADGYYIDNETDLIALINSSRGDIKVYNFGELAVNKTIADVITEYTAGKLIFKNDINIEDAQEVVLNNITFENAATVKEGTTATFNSSVTVNGTLTIEEDATVTLKGGTFNDVKNEGTLSVLAAAEFKATKKVTNEGDLTIKGNDCTVVLNGGNLSYVKSTETGATNSHVMPTLAKPIAKDFTITVGADVTLSCGVAELAYFYAEDEDENEFVGSIVNNGTLNITSATELYSLDNNNKVQLAANLNINGEADNSGTIEGTGIFGVQNDATVTNSGKISAETWMDGEMTMTAQGRVQLKQQSSGTINNTAGGRLYGAESATNLTVYYEFAEGCDLEDLAAVKATQWNINTLVVKGTFNWVEVEGLSLANIADVKKIVLDNATLDIDANTTAKIYTTEVEVKGSVVLCGWNTSSVLEFVQATTVTVAADATLTIRDCNVDMTQTVTIQAGEGTNPSHKAKVIKESTATITGTPNWITTAGFETTGF